MLPSKRKKKNVTQKVEIGYIWISKKWDREMQNAYKHKDVKKNKFKMLLAKNIRYPVNMQLGVKMMLLQKKKMLTWVVLKKREIKLLEKIFPTFFKEMLMEYSMVLWF